MAMLHKIDSKNKILEILRYFSNVREEKQHRFYRRNKTMVSIFTYLTKISLFVAVLVSQKSLLNSTMNSSFSIFSPMGLISFLFFGFAAYVLPIVGLAFIVLGAKQENKCLLVGILFVLLSSCLWIGIIPNPYPGILL